MITSVVTIGNEFVQVNFSAPVTWDGSDPGTLVINGFSGSWQNQNTATQLEWLDDVSNAHNPGEPWTLPGPEPGLTPAPALPQSGITT